MPGGPDISVVVPTCDRDGVLDRTLAALDAQELGGISMEVVVVDNGAPAGALDRLSGSGLRRPPLVVRERAPGAAAARNRGVAAARAPLVLFLGDDCIPSGPDLVRGHAAAHADGSGPRAVTGRIEWDPAVPRSEAMDWLERRGHMVDMARLAREPAGPDTFYTGNVSVARAALLEVAGFDQRFSGYGFEDLEMALRLQDLGVEFVHRPELGVLHSHHYSLDQSLRRMEAVGRGGRLLHAIHDHRRPLPGPPASRLRLALGLALAALPRTEPPLLRDPWMRAVHLAAFARGYAAPPLDDHPRGRGHDAVPRFSEAARPAVSVVVPFLGEAAEAREVAAALGGLRLASGDEVVLVDNGGTAPSGMPGVRVVRADAERSSYHARNAGADAAVNDWLLFLDADCRPPAGLLDHYFREPVPERAGAIAGAVVAATGQDALVARYSASRRYLSQAAHLRDVHRPYAITANLLVRRAAWEEVGGFFEGLRSGGDQDFCWRIQDAGWELAYREPAYVEHLHRERLAPLLRQMARYSAAIAWMGRRAPGSSPRPPVARRLVRSIAGAAAWLGLARRERALFKLLDGAVVLAEAAGYLLSNDAPRADARPATAPPTGVLVAEFPTAAAALTATAAGEGALVEAARRPQQPDRDARVGVPVRFAEDDGLLRRAASIALTRMRDAEGAVATRRLRRAGVRELLADPASRRRAERVAAALGVQLRG